MKTSILFILILLISCASPHAVSEFADSYAAEHQRIAVMPFQSTIKLRPKEMERITDEQWEELEMEQGFMVQSSVVHALNGNNMLVTIQAPSITNDILEENDITFNNWHKQDPTVICRLLNVDALVEGSIATEKPMSDLLANAIQMGQSIERVLLNSSFSGAFSTATNVGSCSLRLVDGKTGYLVYSYQNNLSMGAGSTTQHVIDRFMDQAKQKFRKIYRRAKSRK